MGAWGPYILEWGSILLRWLHVTAAIAWIGGSFFFMHLDASLRKRDGMAKGVYGVSWQVHAGGFYEMSKYTLAPPSLPDDLIWHKWQSYWTWISGFSLLVWVYYGQSSFYLIDPAVLALQPWQAAAIGVISLALGYVVYDLICKSKLGKNDATLLIGVFVYVVATAYVYTLVFSPRGALIHAGALMATMMTANVFLIIMPNQRKTIARMLKGETPDPAWGKQAKQRSTHNNYITLPVLFLMLSNHYPVLYANGRWIPALVTLVIVAGALIRYFYNNWHADHSRAPWWAWLAAAAALWGAFWIATANSPGVQPTLGLAPPVIREAEGQPKAPADVVEVVTTRCSMCHAPEPSWEGIGEAPKGVWLDTPEHIARYAPAIRMQAVLTHAMPPNNLTEISVEERAVLARWLGTSAVN